MSYNIAIQTGYTVFMSVHFVLCVDGLHLSISAQGMPNGEAALQHAAYPGMQPYPGVGMFGAAFFWRTTFFAFSLIGCDNHTIRKSILVLTETQCRFHTSLYIFVCVFVGNRSFPVDTSILLPYIPVRCLFVVSICPHAPWIDDSAKSIDISSSAITLGTFLETISN